MSVLRAIQLGLLAGVLMLAGCGSEGQNPLATTAVALVTGAGKKAPPATMEQQKAAAVQALRASGTDQPVLLVELERQQAVASLVVGGRNQGVVTWLDATGVGIITRGGVVIGTRGLGHDMMAADIRGTQSALRGGSTRGYQKIQSYLNGEAQLEDLTLTCDAQRSGGTLTESCQQLNSARTVTNTYELRSGSVVRSRQWLGRAIGYATITRLQ